MLQTYSRGPITRIHLGRTIVGRPLRTVEAFMLDGILIDSGPPVTAEELAHWGRDRGLREVVNTHHHEDHSGGNKALHQKLGMRIAASEQAVPTLRAFPRLELYRRVVWGQPEDVEAQPLGAAVETERYRLDVIPTPGHCADHVAFFEPTQGWLFSGDLFIHERARYLSAGEDAHQLLDSLRRLLTLDPHLLVCSHAGFVEDPCQALARKIGYWEGIADRAGEMRRGGLPTDKIARLLLGPEGMTARLSRGQFSKQNLIESLLDGK